MSSSQMQEIMEMPREFVKDGTQFINRCTYVFLPISSAISSTLLSRPLFPRADTDIVSSLQKTVKPDKREFLKISQAVGVGFLVMGVIGYVVKLIHIPVNNILVGGA
ncbi:unnamed protein product [Aureobasidium uvarum]|uniref:Uncharacterized protein n=1 Tax=Aureobasidium uvarum TaxID=2773716 RepID=A0A9N8PT08_9PEZI|nr:unnamed protein product [Aureobasidium uvarum]